jgi:hypothetical protein
MAKNHVVLSMIVLFAVTMFRCALDAESSACLMRRNSAACGPYGYDVKELIAKQRAAGMR